LTKIKEFLNKEVKIKLSITHLLYSVFIFYFIWELYWFNVVGYAFIKWHTRLMIYVYCWFFLYFVSILFKKQKINALIFFSSIILVFFVSELFLIITGLKKTYREQINNTYVSHFKPEDNSHYHLWIPNEPHYLTKPEFRYWRPTNSLGFGDEEWPIEKPNNQIRILALGDSFTEGDGAEYDSSYVSILKAKLIEKDTNFYVMNGGVCGSDPFNNFIILKDLLLKYKPNYVIQALASHDLTMDITHRGGFERFLDNGKQEFKKAPWWEPIYAVSYLSRLFFDFAGYDELLMKKKLDKETVLELNNTLIELFETYSKLCKENNIKLFLFLRPEKNEIEDDKYNFDFSTFEEFIFQNNNIIYHDLLPCYISTIKNSNTKAENYFWIYDGHHNAKGYKMMAECIYNGINSGIKND
jgi:hypothetical protein